MAEIINLDKLNLKLDKLANLDISQAIEKACLLVENDAKVLCPVDKGQLRNSLTHELEGNEGYVGTNVEYAPYVEFGTGLFAKEGNGRKTPWMYEDDEGKWHITTGQKPQPFLEDALKKNKKQIPKLIENEIKKQVKEGL